MYVGRYTFSDDIFAKCVDMSPTCHDIQHFGVNLPIPADMTQPTFAAKHATKSSASQGCGWEYQAKWRRLQALVGPKNTMAENLNIVRRSTDHKSPRTHQESILGTPAAVRLFKEDGYHDLLKWRNQALTYEVWQEIRVCCCCFCQSTQWQGVLQLVG